MRGLPLLVAPEAEPRGRFGAARAAVGPPPLVPLKCRAVLLAVGRKSRLLLLLLPPPPSGWAVRVKAVAAKVVPAVRGVSPPVEVPKPGVTNGAAAAAAAEA